MSTLDTTQQRFFRPPDPSRVRRNQHRIQMQRVLVIMRNVVFVAAVAVAALWIFRQTQSAPQFAVKTIEVAGAVHTPREAINAITARYVGLNLFKIDIGVVQHDFASLAWIQRMAIEKKIPDTLRINLVERTPVAIMFGRDGLFDYVDGSGVVLSELSPMIGDDDLPLIAEAEGDELARTVQFVGAIKRSDPALYSRLAVIRPVAPCGFAVFDRELATTIYLNDDDAPSKWRNLYAIVRSEHYAKSDIEYADLRFADRIVIKPVHPLTTSAAVMHPNLPPAQITN